MIYKNINNKHKKNTNNKIIKIIKNESNYDNLKINERLKKH